MQKHTFYLASPSDNVATALVALRKGEQIIPDGTKSVTLQKDIPFGFKFSLREIGCGAPVIKYGEPIGTASAPIGPGELVHVHNVESCRARGDMSR